MHQIYIQYAITQKSPGPLLLKRWANAVLNKRLKKITELTIRIVSKKEMTKLNGQYRQKKYPTNVLSFPLEKPLLGDIIICADVVKQEAIEQKKLFRNHFAHMVVHGTLHLLGYDHVKNKEAEKMEKLEIKILKSLGLPNPYKV